MSLPREMNPGRGQDVQDQAKSLKRTAAEAFLPTDVDENEEDASSSNESRHLGVVGAATNGGGDDEETSSSYITSSSESGDSTDEEDEEDEEEVEDEGIAREHEATATGLETNLPSTSDLHSKLSAFLPKIAQANERLATETNKRLDNVAEDEEHYIEMNLGLGVLTDTSYQKRNNDVRLEESSDGDGDTSAASDDTDGETEQDSNVMETLKGMKTKAKRRKIQELG